jgi:hypothetical protein
LTNLGARLNELGQRETALAVAQEAVDRYRALAATNPDALAPRLLPSLHSRRLLVNQVTLKNVQPFHQDGVDIVVPAFVPALHLAQGASQEASRHQDNHFVNILIISLLDESAFVLSSGIIRVGTSYDHKAAPIRAIQVPPGLTKLVSPYFPKILHLNDKLTHIVSSNPPPELMLHDRPNDITLLHLSRIRLPLDICKALGKQVAHGIKDPLLKSHRTANPLGNHPQLAYDGSQLP